MYSSNTGTTVVVLTVTVPVVVDILHVTADAQYRCAVAKRRQRETLGFQCGTECATLPESATVPRARDVLYLFEKEDVTLSITSVWTLASIRVPVHTPEKVPVGY